MDADIRHGIPRSETKGFITHTRSNGQWVSKFEPVSLISAPTEGQKGPDDTYISRELF